MSNVGKKVTVKLLLKCDAQRKFVNFVDLQFEGWTACSWVLCVSYWSHVTKDKRHASQNCVCFYTNCMWRAYVAELLGLTSQRRSGCKALCHSNEVSDRIRNVIEIQLGVVDIAFGSTPKEYAQLLGRMLLQARVLLRRLPARSRSKSTPRIKVNFGLCCLFCGSSIPL